MTNQTIEIREGWKKYYLIMFFLWTSIEIYAFFISEMSSKNINFIFTCFTLNKIPAYLVLFGIPSVCLFYYFDNRVKIKLDSNGVWSRKIGLISWNEISEFKTTETIEREGNGNTYLIYLKLSNHNKIISYRRMDTNFDDFRKCADIYIKMYNINDLGHFIYK